MKCFITLPLYIVSTMAFCQKTFTDSAATYFKEIKISTNAKKDLWKKDLYGPILLVNSSTRKLYANFNNSAGILKKEGNIYTGMLPGTVNIANTSVHWNGKDWAMIILPLPQNKNDRINLLTHELFHRAQPSLNFKLFNADNNHLDKKDGRIYLRLELEALKKALGAGTAKEMQQHLQNAFAFRKYRQSLYSGADSTENLLEHNEGLAEYTGIVISNRTQQQAKDHFIKAINDFFDNPTYVRSFAYQTIPVYGYLLSQIKKHWNYDVTPKINLTNYFINAFAIRLPADLKHSVEQVFANYNGQNILAQETARQDRIDKLIAEYRNTFINQPHFDIHFEQMNISFDPRNIMPLEDKGTVYPNLRITDKWGILSVEKGALVSSMWDKVSLSNPLKINDKNISGDGWILQLNDSYAIVKDDKTGNFKLSKK